MLTDVWEGGGILLSGRGQGVTMGGDTILSHAVLPYPSFDVEEGVLRGSRDCRRRRSIRVARWEQER